MRTISTLLVFLCLSCAVGTGNSSFITRGAVYNKYKWSGGMRYRWAVETDARARQKFQNKTLLRGTTGLVYCHHIDSPYYRVLVLQVNLGRSFFGGQPMEKFLYERGFIKVMYMTFGDTTYIDTYNLTPNGKVLGEPVFKKFGTLLGPGKYVNNTGNADSMLQTIDEAPKRVSKQDESQTLSGKSNPQSEIKRMDDAVTSDIDQRKMLENMSTIYENTR